MNTPRLEFGKPIPEELLRMHGLGHIIPTAGKSGRNGRSYAMRDNDNPCIAFFGKGIEGQTCKGCVHLSAHGRFHKCAQRGPATRGPKTDHYVNWPACRMYQAK